MGRRPIPLSEEGRAQSRALVPLLGALAPERLVTSPLVRARETAEILAAGLGIPVVDDADVAELDFGAWEGRLYDDLVHEPAYEAFSRDPCQAAPPGGESVATAQARAVAAIGRAFAAAPGARIGVVSHGDVLRAVLAAALALDLREFRRLRVDTASVSGIALTGDWAEVKFVNVLPDPGRVFTPLHWGR